MKKFPALVTIGFILLLAGGYFFYDHFFKKTSISVWDLISPETILVYESGACVACLDEIEKSPIQSIIKQAALESEEVDSLQLIRDLVLSAHYPGKLVSMHLTKKDGFDFIYYIPFKQINNPFQTALVRLQNIKGVKISERVYQDVSIHELVYKSNVFSWIALDNFFVGTFTTVLIEDVIRNYKFHGESFKDELANVYRLPRVKNDGGNLYVHLKNFTKCFSVFTSDPPSNLIQNLGQSALLDVKISDNKFILNGFSIDSTRQSNFILSAFSSQQPVPFTLKQFISNRAIMVASFGISDGEQLNERLKKYAKPQALDTLAQLEKALRIEFKNLYKNFSGEIGISWLESSSDKPSKILLVHNSVGVKEWLKVFETLSNKLSVDTVFFELYSNYEIREVPIYRFPEKLFYPLVSGFDNCYYTVQGNSIFISEDLEDLKQFLDDIDREDTWGKSVAQNKFLEGTLLEANVNLFINTPKVWDVLNNSLHPRWKKFVKDNHVTLNSLGMGAIQFSHLNDNYYTNVSWSFGSVKSKTIQQASYERNSITFQTPIAKMWTVKSHIDKSYEVLVQDSAKNISLVSMQGKALWRLPLNEFISGDIVQIDFFNNGKLQYFFTTPGELHIIDRLGNYVKPYPISIDEQNIEFASLVDYDHSKKYRFLISGKDGKLWMYDKEGSNLEGWQPRNAEESLSAPARHHRILGKDYLIAIRDDGVVYVMNRRGELQKNFPLDLNARPAGDYFLELGKTKADTYFVVISRDGFRIKFNLEGKVSSRETLVKTAADAKFKLVSEKNSKSYLILRQESKHLALFSKDLEPLIVNDFAGNNPVQVQYQNFGGGNAFITITDLVQDLSFVFDGKGNSLTPIPIESHFISVHSLDGGKPLLFYNLQQSFTTRQLQ